MTGVAASVIIQAALVPLCPNNVLKVLGTYLGFIVLAFALLFQHDLRPAWTPLDAPIVAWLVAVTVSTVLSVNLGVSLVPFIGTELRGDSWFTCVAWGASSLAAARLTPHEATIVIYATLAAGIVMVTLTIGQMLDVPWATTIAAANPVGGANQAWGTLSHRAFLEGYICLVGGIVVAWVWRHEPLVIVSGFVILVLAMVFPAGRQMLSWWGFNRGSFTGRFYVWRETWKMIRRRPWTGWGLNTMWILNPYESAVNPHNPGQLAIVGFYDTPHSDILHQLYHTGVLGFAAYLWIWVVAFRNAPMVLAIPLALYALWLVMLWAHVGVHNVWWVFVGLAYALAR